MTDINDDVPVLQLINARIEDLKVELNKISNEYYLLKTENEHFYYVLDRSDKDLKIEKEKYSVLDNKLKEQNSQNDLLKRSLNDKDKIIELMQTNRDLEVEKSGDLDDRYKG